MYEINSVFGGLMCCAVVVPTRDEVSRDTPLRLNVAAALAFPDGSMSERHGYAHDVADVSRCGCHSSRACEPLSVGILRDCGIRVTRRGAHWGRRVVG
jgi:hypothetical protein